MKLILNVSWSSVPTFRWDTETTEGACEQETSPGAKYLPPPASSSQQWRQLAPSRAGWSRPYRRWEAYRYFYTIRYNRNNPDFFKAFFSRICMPLLSKHGKAPRDPNYIKKRIKSQVFKCWILHNEYLLWTELSKSVAELKIIIM